MLCIVVIFAILTVDNGHKHANESMLCQI